MTAHLTVLLDDARRTKGTADAHVWWGKVHSRNGRQDLPHLGKILEIAAELDRDTEDERECRSLPHRLSLAVRGPGGPDLA